MCSLQWALIGMSWAETAVTSRAGKSEQGWCREALRVIEEKGQQILVGKTCLFIKSYNLQLGE